MNYHKNITIQNYLNDDMIILLKEMIGLRFKQVLSFNETRFQSSCRIGEQVVYSLGDGFKLNLYNDERSHLWNVSINNYQDTLFGDICGIKLTCQRMDQSTVLYQYLDLSKYSSTANILEFDEVIKKVEIFGIKTKQKRRIENSEKDLEVDLDINVDQMILFHFESGNKGAIAGHGRGNGGYLNVVSEKYFPEFEKWTLNKKNQLGDKIYELKHEIKY